MGLGGRRKGPLAGLLLAGENSTIIVRNTHLGFIVQLRQVVSAICLFSVLICVAMVQCVAQYLCIKPLHGKVFFMAGVARRQQRDDRNRFVRVRPLAPEDDWIHPLLGEWTRWQLAARRSPRTIANRAPLVQKFAEQVGVDPVSACPDDVVRWFRVNPQWSDATAHAYWNALAAWFNWLERQGHIGGNPLRKLDAPPRPNSVPRPVSDADLGRMLGVRMHRRTRVQILLAALAGLRVSEIAKLRGEDVDLPGRLLYVRGKGRVEKTVPLHPLLALEAARMPATGFWFPGRTGPGRPVNRHSVTHNISRVMGRAGVRGTPHALRHWFGTNALRVSGDVRVVQTLMRHASVTSTEVYTAVADGSRADVVDQLDPFAAARAGFVERRGR